MGRSLSYLKSLFLSECFSSSKSDERNYAKRRLAKELRVMKSDIGHPTHISYGPVSAGNMFEWQGIIMGCFGTPFEGGIFKLSIKLPVQYPMKPPRIKFQTKVYHPNIDGDGRIHIDTLGDQWSPALTIEKLVLSICSVLHDPAVEKKGSHIASLYLHHTDQYNKRARKWTRKYAV